MTRALLDRFWQLVFRVGFKVLLGYRFFVRPYHEGALVAVWSEGSVLLIRNSYRSAWSFPGGSVKRGEQPLQAACRELCEEVGLAVDPDNLRYIGAIDAVHEFQHDHCHFFELRLRQNPSLQLDNREVTVSRFVARESAFDFPLVRVVQLYLESVS